jgi:hypothetical protein
MPCNDRASCKCRKCFKRFEEYFKRVEGNPNYKVEGK